VSIFGRIITGDHVESAVEQTVRAFQADYLAEVAEQSGLPRGALPKFRSFPRLTDLSKWEEDQTPSCMIAAPGTLQTPTTQRGAVNARWAVGIGCIVSAKDMQTTLRLCQLYTAAMRALLLQHRSLGGFSDGLSFISERYDEQDPERNIATGVAQFSVDVLGITEVDAGPSTPSDDATLPVGDWPEVATVYIDAEKVN
jgi:hypothetical protein